MNWQDFRNDLVIPYARQTGISAFDISDTVSINNLISRGLKDFTRYTYCLFSEKYDITTTPNQYELSTGLIFQPLTITIDGTLLRRTDGEPGIESLALLKTPTWNNWANMPAGKPSIAIAKPGNKLLLIPTPDAAYTGYITGWREHQTYVDDSTGIEIEDAWLDIAAMWCAQKLAYPAATGQSIFTQVFARDRKLAESIRLYRHENLRSIMPVINTPPKTYRYFRGFWRG